VACGIPTLQMGYNLEDIATGIDEYLIRNPLGVFGIIGPCIIGYGKQKEARRYQI
jgi:malonate-semialdehyde dehydrogenase (acetylating)/methylmalonate-semialdehyde dehydrogenase